MPSCRAIKCATPSRCVTRQPRYKLQRGGCAPGSADRLLGSKLDGRYERQRSDLDGLYDPGGENRSIVLPRRWRMQDGTFVTNEATLTVQGEGETALTSPNLVAQAVSW